MPTYNQLVRNPRKAKKKNIKESLGSPQQEGVVDEVFKKTPNKPNSALRSVVKAILKKSKRKSQKIVFAYVPGEGHNLQKYSVVLIQGGGAQDLTGVRRSVVRGARDPDTKGVENRKQGRSKYGTKKK